VTPLQTQYASLTERRLHYGRMFWQNIAFHVAGVLAAGFLLALWHVAGMALGAAVICLGLATLLMTYIAYRLVRLEGVYDGQLRAVEAHWIAAGEAGVQLSPVSDRSSSRLVVVAGLAVAGLILILLGSASVLQGDRSASLSSSAPAAPAPPR
jgi:hypothetical protein